MLRKILTNPLLMQSLWSLIARFTGVALNFAVILIITNMLPKSSAGDLLLLITFVTGVALISRLGIDQLLMKEVASSHQDDDRFRKGFLSVSYKSVFLLSLVFMGIWLLASSFLQARFFTVTELSNTGLSSTGLTNTGLAAVSLNEIMLASIGILFFNIVILNSTYLKAIKHTVMGILGQNALTAITFLGLILIFWKYFTNDEYTVYLYIASLVLAGVLAFLITRFYTSNLSDHNDTSSLCVPKIKQILIKSLPLAPISIISFLMIFSDTIMVGWFLPNEQVAEYSVASKISYIILFFLQAMEAVIYPRLLNMYQHNQGQLKAFFWQSTALVVGVVLSITLIMYLLSDWILIAFGSEYTVAKQALGLLLVAQLLRAASITFSFMYIIREKVKYLNIILVTAFITNVVANIILIQSHGIEGAALATLIANAVLLFFVIALFFGHRLLKGITVNKNVNEKPIT